MRAADGYEILVTRTRADRKAVWSRWAFVVKKDSQTVAQGMEIHETRQSAFIAGRAKIKELLG